jgi:hypothetical protein
MVLDTKYGMLSVISKHFMLNVILLIVFTLSVMALRADASKLSPLLKCKHFLMVYACMK